MLISFLLVSCSSQSTKNEHKITSQTKIVETESNDVIHLKSNNTSAIDSITVMVIPCSNGYEYDLKMGDLNPSLNNYLMADKRVILKPFPLKEMNGSGYFGVFDKKYCSEILKKVDVDFLIMTRMKGMDLSSAKMDTGNWGYETKILNVNTMQQFSGIEAKNLESFDEIDSDIQQKMDELIGLLTK